MNISEEPQNDAPLQTNLCFCGRGGRRRTSEGQLTFRSSRIFPAEEKPECSPGLSRFYTKNQKVSAVK